LSSNLKAFWFARSMNGALSVILCRNKEFLNLKPEVCTQYMNMVFYMFFKQMGIILPFMPLGLNLDDDSWNVAAEGMGMLELPYLFIIPSWEISKPGSF